eukprot:TRINITY_DN121189_c0_g1_i1.p1 TRINITY_DN121189_c0_g1~~TRINITY_DN121189_c0_g1_i1.p1  ORF type:complete len:363 (+),score=50.75 TRINITY_DN121189_c0_g1_i1:93-1181(+)
MTYGRLASFLQSACTGAPQCALLFAAALLLTTLPVVESRQLAKSARQGQAMQGGEPGAGLAVLQARWPELDTEIIRPEHSVPVPKAVVDAAAVADNLAAEIARGPQPSDADRVRSGLEAQHMSAGGQTLNGFLQSGHAQYTHNAICLPRYCVNPIFPAMMINKESVFEHNEQLKWKCVESAPVAWKKAGFCGQLVAGYQFAIPEPIENENHSIIFQEHKAINAYVAHVSGIGHDFWDYTQPWNHDECIQQIWKLSCYTHFPRCSAVNPQEYLRPCASSCQAYVDKCAVECCDEGTQCVFSHNKVLADGSILSQTGFVPRSGPSPLCTGRAAPSVGMSSSLLAVGVLSIAQLASFGASELRGL